jgi:uncharacterized protein YajQ (UPF0234 family)
MPSFDVVNEIDLQEVDNAVNITKKTLATRYDFRGSDTEVNLDRKQLHITISTEDTMRMQAVQDTLSSNLIKRKLSPKVLEYKEPEGTSKGGLRVTVVLKQGIDKDMAKKITKIIKDQKLKVQTQIQDEQVRVTAKKIDDLQEVISMLKEQDLDIPLQFVNMKS